MDVCPLTSTVKDIVEHDSERKTEESGEKNAKKQQKQIDDDAVGDDDEGIKLNDHWQINTGHRACRLI